MRSLRVHALFHAPFEGLGAINAWLKALACQVDVTHLYLGEATPSVEDFDWLIVMGGPMSVHDEKEFPWLSAEKELVVNAIAEGKTVLGFCLGAQIISASLGGQVTRNPHREIGWNPVEAIPFDDEVGMNAEQAQNPPSWIKSRMPDALMTFHWHGETFSLPPGAECLASSSACINQGFAYGDRVVGLQFHPEMEPEGIGKLIENCNADRIPGPYVQTGDEVFGKPEYFAVNRFFLEELLEGLHSRTLQYLSRKD